MRRWGLFPLFLIAVLGTYSAAVESGYQPLTIIRAEVKTRDRVLLYLVNTPIYQEDPYFEVAVRAGDQVLIGERDPEKKLEILPLDWKPGALVLGRADKHHLFLKRPDGTEMKFIITRRKKTPPEKEQ